MDTALFEESTPNLNLMSVMER